MSLVPRVGFKFQTVSCEPGRMFPSWKINDSWGCLRFFSLRQRLKVLFFCVSEFTLDPSGARHIGKSCNFNNFFSQTTLFRQRYYARSITGLDDLAKNH